MLLNGNVAITLCVMHDNAGKFLKQNCVPGASKDTISKVRIS